MPPNARLRELRAARRMTQGDLAVAARSTVPYIGFIERAGHTPGPDLRRRIAKAFGVVESEIWPDITDNAGN